MSSLEFAESGEELGGLCLSEDEGGLGNDACCAVLLDEHALVPHVSDELGARCGGVGLEPEGSSAGSGGGHTGDTEALSPLGDDLADLADLLKEATVLYTLMNGFQESHVVFTAAKVDGGALREVAGDLCPLSEGYVVCRWTLVLPEALA